MSDCPDELYYSNSHEWVRVEDDDIAVIGITDYAQAQLGDLVYVELPMIADQMTAGREAGVVESVKTASDIYSPVTGEVVAINDELTAQPETINQDPYDKGWLFKVKLSDQSEIDNLLSAEAYQQTIEDE